MIIDAEISISRNNHDEFHISFKDQASLITFASVKLTPHQIAMALSGVVTGEAVPCEVRGLDRVGKVKVREKRTIFLPDDAGVPKHNREAQREWLNRVEENGWFIDSYLGSQNSVKYLDDGVELRYAVYKFVDKDELS